MDVLVSFSSMLSDLKPIAQFDKITCSNGNGNGNYVEDNSAVFFLNIFSQKHKLSRVKTRRFKSLQRMKYSLSYATLISQLIQIRFENLKIELKCNTLLGWLEQGRESLM